MNKQESKYFNTASYMDEALLSLLEKKEYEFITVKEICQKAGVNRSTFYLHYENIDDLLEETVRYVSDKFALSFDGINNKSNLEKEILTSEKFLKPYLSFIKDNKKIYKLMHDKPHLFNLENISKSLYENVFNFALNNYEVKEEEKKYIFSFYTQGVIGIINAWLKGDCKDEIDFIIIIIERNTFVNEKDNKENQ